MNHADKGSVSGLPPVPVRRWKILDGSMLKLIAVITMLMDHTASALLENNYFVIFRFGERTIDLYEAMRIIGRISFPLYAFLLVEGFLHTRSVKRYTGSILAFALLSEIPWNLMHSGKLTFSGQNVMFTLLFGLLAIWTIRDYHGDRRIKALLLFGLLALSFVFRADYGAQGFGFIIMMYLLRDRELYRALTGCCILPALWKAGIAFIPVSMYNGQRGFIRNKPLKYAFYLVYPLHLLILYWIRTRTVGF